MKKLLKNTWFNLLLIVGFTATVLYFTIFDYIDDIFIVLSRVSPLYLTLTLILALLYHVIIGGILTKLTRISNPRYKYKHGIVNAFVAAFFHGVTPSASGGQFAQVYIYRKQGVLLSDAASVLWMDFILYQSTMVFSVLILLLLRFSYFFTVHSTLLLLVLIGFAVNSMVIISLWSLARLPKFHFWVSTKGIDLAHRWKLVKNKEKLHKNMEAQIERFQVEKNKLSSHLPIITQVVFANMIRLAIYYLLPFVIIKALGIDMGKYIWLDVMALSSFVAMINAFIPIPGASGGTEATFIFMFTRIVGFINASSVMLIWRFASYYLIMILGGCVFLAVKWYYSRME